MSYEHGPQAPSVYHTRDCMDAWMFACGCGAEANQARVIPSAKDESQ